MALKQTKMCLLYNKLKGKKQDGNEEKPLMKNIKQTNGEMTIEYMESSDQSGLVYPDLIGPDVKPSGKKELDILRKILNEQINNDDLDKAAKVLKRWGKLNGVTIDKKEGRFPKNWLCEYHQEIDLFVENHIPTLPVEGPQGSQLEQLQDFLKSTQNMICHEVLRLTPVLEDAGLLDRLIESYSRHLFPKLVLLLNRDLSVKESFCLLKWGKEVFFSPDLQHFFRVSDPLLLTGWFEKAIRKLLPILKNDISETLQNILLYKQHGHNEESIDEESFIRVHIDVTQYLNSVLTNSEAFSKTLKGTAQNICLKELHRFAQKYVDAEKKHLTNWKPLNTNSVYLFRVISTCRQLRFFAPQLNNPDIKKSNDLLNIICCILTELEDHVLSIVQKMMKHLAQDSLRRYFKKGYEQIHSLTEAIRKQCASLPQNDVGKEIQEIFVNVAYDCVSRVYLDCLMKSKIKRLEKRWGNVGERMREDALNFHNTFTELSGSNDQRNQLLQRLSEVLLFSDVNALKVTCCDFSQKFPKDSEQYVPGLLRWKGVLSERQVREILTVIRDLRQDSNPGCVTRHSLKGLCCCL